MNILLYLFVVLIWGTTWIAIAAQHNQFSPVVGVFWRFLIASAILFIILISFKRLQALSFKDHIFCFLQGMCVFGFNFLCFYIAIEYINSGLESVIFSMAVLFNALNSRIFLKQEISASLIPAALLGSVGIISLFWYDLISTKIHWQTFAGIGLCVLGTLGFSLGNMVAIRHQKNNLDIFSTNAYGMLYGAMVMGVIAMIRQENFLPVVSGTALFALGYLAVFGSVIGFAAYFMLIDRIGAGQAAYSTLLFPLVALSISTFWENYQWHLSAVLGVFFILLGNYIFFRQPTWLLRHFGK